MEEQSILIISGAEVARVFVGDIVLVEQEGRLRPGEVEQFPAWCLSDKEQKCEF